VNTYITKALLSLGLCVATVGLIVQFAATSHTFTL